MNAIETEMHFWLIYPNYKKLRRQFLTPYFCRLLTVQKFKTLMTTTSPKTLSNISFPFFRNYRSNLNTLLCLRSFSVYRRIPDRGYTNNDYNKEVLTGHVQLILGLRMFKKLYWASGEVKHNKKCLVFNF